MPNDRAARRLIKPHLRNISSQLLLVHTRERGRGSCMNSRGVLKPKHRPSVATLHSHYGAQSPCQNKPNNRCKKSETFLATDLVRSRQIQRCTTKISTTKNKPNSSQTKVNQTLERQPDFALTGQGTRVRVRVRIQRQHENTVCFSNTCKE